MRRYLLLVVAACTIPGQRAERRRPGRRQLMPTGPIETRITQAPAMFSKDEVARFEFTSNVASAKFTCRIDDKRLSIAHRRSRRSSRTARITSRYARPIATAPASPPSICGRSTPSRRKPTLTTAPPANDNSTTVTFEFSANEDERHVRVLARLERVRGVPQRRLVRSARRRRAYVRGAREGSRRQRRCVAGEAQMGCRHLDARHALRRRTAELDARAGPRRSRSSRPMRAPARSSSARSTTIRSSFARRRAPTSLSKASTRSRFACVISVGNFDPTPATATWSVDPTPPRRRSRVLRAGAVPRHARASRSRRMSRASRSS